MKHPSFDKITAIIQARMSSKRFPGKTLHRVDGKPMLQYLLERLARCENLSHWVVATSMDSTDEPIVTFCNENMTPCIRGALENVAQRYLETVERYNLPAFVRVNGDSPLLDPALIDKAVQLFSSGDYDVVTNVMERTYPRGQSVEVVRSEAFRKAYAMAKGDDQFEHVTQAFYTNPSFFKILNFRAERSYKDIHFSVDTPEDMARFEQIVNRMDRPHWFYGLDELVPLSQGAKRETQHG
jgi:spore coat polysaccharide biosynthesis protein SpsF